MDPQRIAAVQRTLAAAGFDDLPDAPTAFALHEIADASCAGPLHTFDDVNDRVGTRNGLASGWVTRQLARLRDLGYLTVSTDGRVELTDRGRGAAECLGLAVPDRG